MRAKKYRKGTRVKSIAALVRLLGAGEWVYVWDRPKHPRVVLAMTMETVLGFLRVRKGWLRIRATSRRCWT